MSTQPLSAIEQRLLNQVRDYATQYSGGALSIAELRAAMRATIAQAQTAAMLVGTGAQRNGDIDAALRDAINAAWDELDRALQIIETRQPDADEVRRRLEGFADQLEDTQQRGEELAQEPQSPLVPIAIGGALGALIGRVIQQRRQPQADAGTGRFVGRISLPRVDTGIVQRLFNLFGGNVDTLAAQLARGEISLDGWYDAMRRLVIQAHTGMYRAGVGRDLTPEDRQRINARLREQLDYLDRWVRELEGQDQYNEAQIRNRARLYLNATNATLQDARAAAIGLPELPALPGDGTTLCRVNCKCTWRIVQLDGDGNYDVYWRLRPAEHCETCVRRAAAWAPIRIRGGVLGPYEPIFD